MPIECSKGIKNSTTRADLSYTCGSHPWVSRLGCTISQYVRRKRSMWSRLTMLSRWTMIGRLSLRAKLTGAFIAVAIVAGFIGLVGWNGLNAAKADFDEVANIRLPTLQILGDLTSAMEDVQLIQNAMLSVDSSMVSVDFLEAGDINSYVTATLNSYNADRTKALSRADAARKAYEALPRSAEEQEIWTQFSTAWSDWIGDNQAIVDLLNKRTSGSSMMASSYASTTGSISSQRAGTLLRKLVEINYTRTQETGRQTQDRLSLNTTVLVSAMAFGVLIALFFSVFLSRNIARGIGRVVAVASEIAQGDLTRRIDVASRDELGKLASAFNHLADSLHDTIEQIANSGDRVASASEELSATSEQLSSGVDAQLLQSQQIASAMHEMSASVLEVAKNAQEAAAAAKHAEDTANSGADIVGQTIEGIKRIALTVEDTAGKVAALGTSSSQIGDIIEVIDDIADQTNLLALNAAIEAARAGEQGRGFAVVADEVRKLAERTTTATKEITKMITSIQKETKQAVQSMEGGRSLTAEGVKMANRAESALQEIVQVAERVGGMVTLIASAAEEQSTATEQINASVENITVVIRQTGEGARQSARATEELAQLALDQQTLVGKFKLSDESSSTPQKIVSHPKLKLAI
ncbi:MAG: methyl-accepting chemotaxis protein [Chloroflexota bacterium]|nr:MAG: methyl-accepting chemotaxis protein [Chloroflexota bacterium]